MMYEERVSALRMGAENPQAVSEALSLVEYFAKKLKADYEDNEPDDEATRKIYAVLAFDYAFEWLREKNS